LGDPVTGNWGKLHKIGFLANIRRNFESFKLSNEMREHCVNPKIAFKEVGS